MRLTRLILIALASVLAMAMTGDLSKPVAALETSLVALEKQSWEAWKKRDGRFFQTFLSDDHVEVGFAGRSTKTAVVAFVASDVCVVSDYKLDSFRLTSFTKDTALLTYYAEQNTTCGGKPVPSPVWVSSLYVKRGGHWQNVLYQQTQTQQKAR